MRTAFVAVALVLSASASFAQVVETVEALAPQQRQGTFTTSSVRLPDTISGTVSVYGSGMTDAVLADPANIVRLHVYVSGDNGATWRYAGGIEWRGGSANKDGTWNRPGLISHGVEVYRGFLVRAEVDIPQRIRIGAEVIFTP